LEIRCSCDKQCSTLASMLIVRNAPNCTEQQSIRRGQISAILELLQNGLIQQKHLVDVGFDNIFLTSTGGGIPKCLKRLAEHPICPFIAPSTQFAESI